MSKNHEVREARMGEQVLGEFNATGPNCQGWQRFGAYSTLLVEELAEDNNITCATLPSEPPPPATPRHLYLPLVVAQP